ncbi:MAG: AAA family ATPase [Microcoleus sp. PH2017_40_RAT_O_B]|uniref:ParA family protein n=1 Tax=unclassified Microcoleus TaxID=2642155 RepID=UPI001DE1FE68|nr:MULTISPECIES: AAA family ATPase [unclassified Microcoleus]MCC3570249.1 AAA family ATPase [Microcoleus sp. PH2017_34_RAT_O_A]MCC3608481.1 AAA family ATPase [Microcoleus sp. PH2017_40_RAT_O_B]
MNAPATTLQAALQSLPQDASEAIVSANFLPQFLQALGFESDEVIPQYDTNGGGIVDRAARKTIGNDIFLHTKYNPYLLVELKGKDINLTEGTPAYLKTVNQLKRQLLGSNCTSAEWGILTNSSHVQLFRKHGKVIFPATQCLAMDLNNVDRVVAEIRKKIEETSRALTVTIYNNKGGVGKTTTTVNLAGILTFLGKKVLVIDFDFNQQDLTSALGIPVSDGLVKKALTDQNVELKSAVVTYKFSNKKLQLSFDIIPADSELANNSDRELSELMRLYALYDKLEFARQDYDYILIDSSPNWRFNSKLPVYAADVILIPTKHNNLFSLENAAMAIQKFIPEIQAEKEDGSPIALPIFFNGEKITEPQREVAQQAINNIMKNAKKVKFDLLPYFYPKYTNARKDLHIHEVPSYANIASAAFSRIPAVYRDRSAHEYYKNLAKEYFLQNEKH